MTITYHETVIQGSDEWRAMRCGLITASEVSLLLTPETLKIAENDKSRAHVWELTAQRISKYVEPEYISGDMLRGEDEEILAREAYAKHYAPVTEVGFVTNDEWGFTLGYSPDGLVGEPGLFEAKSRNQRLQVQTLLEHLPAGTIPKEHRLQAQTGLLVTRRSWLDYISYSGGLPMAVIRVLPDAKIQAAIIEMARNTEAVIEAKVAKYAAATAGLIPTKRRDYEDMRL